MTERTSLRRLAIPAAGVVLALALLALRGGPAPSGARPAPAAEAPPGPAPEAARAALGPAPAPEKALRGPEAAEAAAPERSMPPPDQIDRDAENPAIEPELPQTPEWKMGKTQQILRVVEARAARVEAEIGALEAEGKAAEAAERRVLLGRLRKQTEKMRAEIGRYTEQILASGGKVPEGGFGPDGAPR
ncbi:MAG TPA: hypothetical protein VFS43_31725 [Polyangiaceae bacterium]|nr:hypothetical protein [Polyangiaceae bacterium]